MLREEWFYGFAYWDIDSNASSLKDGQYKEKVFSI